MKKGRPSRTAEYMALFRALEATRSAGRRVFEDRFAAAFLSPPLRLVVGLSKVPVVGALIRAFIDRRWPGARTSAVARTRFIDDAVEVALRSGIEQVVILGAGFDARAYRIAAMAQVAVVFEVDHPSTSAAKRTLVQAALASLPRHVRFVPVDFDSEPLPGRMSGAGYDPSRRTLFLWEGVTNYLTEEAVDGTLRWCAGAGAGSTVVFTYVHRQVLDAPQAFHGTEKLFKTLSAAGERWTFGLDPSHLSNFLAQRGLALGEDVGASDYRALCFGSAARRMRGYEFYRIAVARVPDPPPTPTTAQPQVAARERVGAPASVDDGCHLGEPQGSEQLEHIRALPEVRRGVEPVSSWAALEASAPAFAAAGRRLLVGADGVAIGFLATVGARGAPHLSPVCPIFSGGALYLSAGAHTLKVADLRAAGAYVLHAFLAANDEEFQASGHAVEVHDQAERAAVHAAIAFAAFKTSDPIFRLSIERVSWVYWERVGQPDTKAVRRRWVASPGVA